MRLCKETENELKAVGTPDGWLQVVEKLQHRVCDEFGVKADVGLTALRRAEDLLPEDAEIQEISLYRKYNRCRDGTLQVTHSPPDVMLVHLKTDENTTLHDILANPLPTVVFAGSYT